MKLPRIVIAGASSFVGRQLVPQLCDRGADLLLLGQDTAALARAFPELSRCDYARLAECGRGFDTLVDLEPVDLDDPNGRGVPSSVLKQEATRCGIARLVTVSNIQDLECVDSYDKAERHRASALPATESVYVGLVHGQDYPKPLAFLSKPPQTVGRILFEAAAAFVPTTNVSLLADHIVAGGNALAVLTDGQVSNRFYAAGRMVLDWGVASAIVIFLWWLMIVAWFAIRWDSPGPSIFAQTRVGRRGNNFVCFKFRTMSQGTPSVATHEARSSSITRMGGVLRRTKLDELPQFWNIFRNEMSVVGPRPGLPVQTELFEERRTRGVFLLMPGITGLAQINGVDMSDPPRLARWDERYLALQNLALDAQIILATVLGRGRGDRIRT